MVLDRVVVAVEVDLDVGVVRGALTDVLMEARLSIRLQIFREQAERYLILLNDQF